MDVHTQVIESIKKIGTNNSGGSFGQKIKLFAWETGLGTVINAMPSAFGEQAVIYFPGRSRKYSLPCYEDEGRILLALSENEKESLQENLLQSPGVEVWLKNGWYAGTARLLTAEEQAAVFETVSNERFFGKMSGILEKRDLHDHYLLEVKRSAPCTGSSGPGSKAWVWTLAALFLLLRKKKR